jgi:hypothetical protein
MRRILIAGMTMFGCLFGQTATAQDVVEGGVEADHQALRELKAVFEKAASENNLDLLRPHVNENFSAVTYTDREFTNGAGKEFRFTSHWTAVCRNIDDEWKIVRAHSSLDPFGNPMLVDGVTNKIWQTAIVAALVGLVVGGVVTYLVTRGRTRPGAA